MDSLKCFSLNGSDVVEGILSSSFDSIVSDSDTITSAAVQTFPLIKDPQVYDASSFEQITQAALVFLRDPEEGDSPSDMGIILSVDPDEWMLTTDKPQVVILDPGGKDDRVLLYIGRNQPGVLLQQNSRKPCCFSVTEDNEPHVGPFNRAAALLSALDDQYVLSTLVSREEPPSVAAPKIGTARRRCTRQAAPTEEQ